MKNSSIAPSKQEVLNILCKARDEVVRKYTLPATQGALAPVPPALLFQTVKNPIFRLCTLLSPITTIPTCTSKMPQEKAVPFASSAIISALSLFCTSFGLFVTNNGPHVFNQKMWNATRNFTAGGVAALLAQYALIRDINAWEKHEQAECA